MIATLDPPRVGDKLSPRVVVPTTTDLVKFAAASSDYNLIHYDQDYAKSRGFPSVIVHGFFKAALLSELALAHAPEGTWCRYLKATYRGFDRVGFPIVLNGEVSDVEKSAGNVTVALTTSNPEGKLTTECTVVLAWSAMTGDSTA